jgi:hypothetical protein
LKVAGSHASRTFAIGAPAGSHASRTFAIGAPAAGAAGAARASATAIPAPAVLRMDLSVSLRWSHLPRPLGRPALRARAAGGSIHP